MRAPPESFSPITGAPFRIGEVHHLADLLGERLAERAAEHGEVLREHVDEPPVDPPVAGDDAVAVDALLLEPEVVRAVHDEAVQLDEAALVEQQVEPLARRQLSLACCASSRSGAAAQLRLRRTALQERHPLTHRHRSEKVARVTMPF